ncbi:MAG: NAD-dependent epimerase/dehydratase family protein [Candidatus Heimdallarchaeaceae archaeon]|jgi:nucleoside-diphosphate-sugar epimerase
MKVLLTGAFGNVGQRTLKLLLERGHTVRCFDVKNPRNVAIESQIKQKMDFETIWGDIRDEKTVEKIVYGIDWIIHLAAIIPPLAYECPELAYDVNVRGSTYLLQAAESMVVPPKIVYASSIAVHGNRMKFQPPTRVDDPIDPLEYDNYAQHKVEMEGRLKKSLLDWVILRFAAVTPFEMSWKIPDIMFDIPLDQRIEIVDTRDVALACVNAMDAKVISKTLFIGGGKGNQLLQGEFVSKMLEAFGIGMLPEEVFKPVRTVDDYYHCDWMNTIEAQKLLKFQNHTFDDFIEVYRKQIGFRRFIIKLFRPLARSILISKSPYYRKQKKRRNRYRLEDKPTKSRA